MRSGDTVLDIGAWVGPYTLLASRLVEPGGHVFAFEPDPAARDLLERNLDANDVRNVTVLPYAVGARDEWGSLEYGQPGDSQTRVLRGSEESDGSVQVVALSSFCDRRALQPSVIKIDVEGAEADVLAESAADVIARTRTIFVELHEDELHTRGSSSEVLVNRLLDHGGFLVEIMDRGGGRNIAIVNPSGAEGWY